MNIYSIEYRQKLTSAQKAVARYLERHNDLGIHSELFVSIFLTGCLKDSDTVDQSAVTVTVTVTATESLKN